MADETSVRGQSGVVVSVLHETLARLGHPVPAEELAATTHGEGTAAIVVSLQLSIGLPPTGNVDAETSDAFRALLAERCRVTDSPSEARRTFRVQGTVRRARGGFVANAIVRAFDRDLRGEQLLGQGRTNHSGRYSIDYSFDAFSLLDVGTADLVVRAFVDEKQVDHSEGGGVQGRREAFGICR